MHTRRLILLAACVPVLLGAGTGCRHKRDCCRPDTIVAAPPPPLPVAAGYCDNCR